MNNSKEEKSVLESKSTSKVKNGMSKFDRFVSLAEIVAGILYIITSLYEIKVTPKNVAPETLSSVNTIQLILLCIICVGFIIACSFCMYDYIKQFKFKKK